MDWEGEGRGRNVGVVEKAVGEHGCQGEERRCEDEKKSCQICAASWDGEGDSDGKDEEFLDLLVVSRSLCGAQLNTP